MYAAEERFQKALSFAVTASAMANREAMKMFRYHEIARCRQCGRIYSKHVSPACQRCGIQLINPDGSRSQNLELVIARRGIRRWKIRNIVPPKKSLQNQIEKK